MPLQYLTNVIKKRCTAFVISDFIDEGFDDALKIANKKHDIVSVRIFDKRETEIPRIGLLRVRNAESGKDMWLDTSNSVVQSSYKTWWAKHEDYLNSAFMKTGVDSVNISTNEDYVKPLMGLFKRRGARK